MYESLSYVQLVLYTPSYLYTCIYSYVVIRRCVVDIINVVCESPSDSSPPSAYIHYIIKLLTYRYRNFI